LTYNIRACVAADGVVRPELIVEVLRDSGANLIALQEVDAEPGEGTSQAAFIAGVLGLQHSFFPVEVGGFRAFGLAVLSSLPIREIRADHLPQLYGRLKPRRRGAQLVAVETAAGPVHLLNTHPSLFRLERSRQVRRLLGREWLGSLPPVAPSIVCGDLNAKPRSRAYRKLARGRVDVQLAVDAPRRATYTYHTRNLRKRIDYILASPHFGVERAGVFGGSLAKQASDHLPVLAHLEFAEAGGVSMAN
jgi:endonuclease/exonuclease/phosphatase family metal-dependent hydrolase